MDAARGRGEFSFVAPGRGLLKCLFLGRLIRRRDIGNDLQLVEEPAVRRQHVRHDLDCFSVCAKVRPHSRIENFANRAAGKLACPLRKSRPAHPVFSPAAAQIRGKRHHLSETVAPGNQQRILVRSHQQLGARLGIGEHVAAQRRQMILRNAFKRPGRRNDGRCNRLFDQQIARD